MSSSGDGECHAVSMPDASSEETRALDDILARMDAEHGPVDEKAVAALMTRLAD